MAASFLNVLSSSLSSLALSSLSRESGQRRLAADVEKHDRVVSGGAPQLVVEQALVDDADVLGAQVGEVDGPATQRAPRPARTLTLPTFSSRRSR